jgi:predicted flap endonuclease-1-like 5' DNA nuclease
MAKLAKVEGIGKVYAQKLQEAGIRTTQALLEKGATPQGREEMAEKTGISGKLILEWVNHIDLFRIKGVGEEYSDLLEAAGVDTVPELAQRNPENLYQKLATVNQEKKLVRQLPTRTQISNWIEQAKQLPRVITY